jgi:hypothetical protein
MATDIVPERFCTSQGERINPDLGRNGQYSCSSYAPGFQCPFDITDVQVGDGNRLYVRKCEEFHPIDGLATMLNSPVPKAN